MNPLKLYGKGGSDDSLDGQLSSEDSLVKLLHAGEEYEPEVDDIHISFDPERQAEDDFFKWRADYLAGDPIRKHFSDAQIEETYKKMKEVDDIPISLDLKRQADDDFFKWRVDYLAGDPIRKHFNDAQIGETYKKMKDAKGFELWRLGYLAEDAVFKLLSDSQLKETLENTEMHSSIPQCLIGVHSISIWKPWFICTSNILLF